METNEKPLENVSRTAIMEVRMSMACVSVRLAICREVITKRQNPRRFAEVPKMCCEVLFAIKII